VAGRKSSSQSPSRISGEVTTDAEALLERKSLLGSSVGCGFVNEIVSQKEKGR